MTEFEGKPVGCWILRTNSYADKQLTNHHRYMNSRSCFQKQNVISEYSLSLEGCLFSLLIDEKYKSVIDKMWDWYALRHHPVQASQVELFSLSNHNWLVMAAWLAMFRRIIGLCAETGEKWVRWINNVCGGLNRKSVSLRRILILTSTSRSH